jgi:arylsulfatase A-like enzyme
VSAEFGLEQGFREHKVMARTDLSSGAVLAETIRWLETRTREQPFFLYLHTLDPHHPYLPEEPFRLRFAADAGELFESILAERSRLNWEPTEGTRRQLLALYDAEIAQNDDAFGRTLDYLEDEGLFEDALIVFLSDHGEEFYEHRAWTHGANLFSQTTNTPLVLKLPGQTEGRRIGRVAQHIDLLPTLLDYLDLDHDLDGLRGRSLLGDIEGSNLEIDAPPVFSHTFRNKKENLAVIDGEWKYMIRDVPGDSWQALINWKHDPRELENLTESYPIRSEFMDALIRNELKLGALATAKEAVLDEETRNALRALGYLD